VNRADTSADLGRSPYPPDLKSNRPVIGSGEAFGTPFV